MHMRTNTRPNPHLRREQKLAFGWSYIVVGGYPDEVQSLFAPFMDR